MHPLSRRGRGEVFRAEDLLLGEDVALEILPAAIAARAKRRQRLFDEVKLARQVAHPNVCRIHDVAEHDGTLFLVMELVDGDDLALLLRRLGRFEASKVIEIGRDVCRGLAAIHGKGIFQPDLQLSNLLLDHRGAVRIADFGLSALVTPEEDLDRVGERARTAQDDLHALGAVLYELLTGREPFPERCHPNEEANEETEVTPPSRWVKRLDKDLERLILRCLAPRPEDRPRSARALAVELASLGTTAGSVRLQTLVVMASAPEPPDASTSPLPSLLEAHDGRTVDAPEAADALLFDRPIDAVRFALALQEADRKPGDGPRIGIHLGEVHVGEQGSSDNVLEPAPIALGKPGLARARRLASVAVPGQILLSHGAFDLARSSALPGLPGVRWLAHGRYELQGLDGALDIYEVGQEASAPLRAPSESDGIRRATDQEAVAGWRPAPDLTVPQRPDWRLLRRLGMGGFGEVWLAEQTTTGERRVFKFCHDTTRLETLQRELTLLRLIKESLGARDDIVHVLGWSFDAAPYFIELEHVSGGDLAQWAAEQGGLAQVSLEVRLELVAQVATALAAAHSVGVLHKDVKPENVLITTDDPRRPRARLGDFGIGWLTDHHRLTAAGITVQGLTRIADATDPLSASTPLYTSPEILEGRPPTLQADIYALGVLLYQMVMGDLSRALAPGWERDVDDELLCDDIAAAVEGVAERRVHPLQLAARLRSLEDRRSRRREEERAQAELEAERRALARARKRRKLVLASMVVLSLSVAILGAQARRIRREAETAQEVSAFLVDLFKVSDPDAAVGDKLRAGQILEWGVGKIERELDDQPQVRARLMQMLGEVYANLGLFDAALPLLDGALELRRELFGDEHPLVADSLDALAEALIAQGDLGRAEALARQSLELRQRLFGEDDPAVAGSLETLGRVELAAAATAEAERTLETALGIRRADRARPLELASALEDLAEARQRGGKLDAAEDACREALGIRRRVLGDEHPDVARSLVQLAHLLAADGRLVAAEEMHREALALRRGLVGSEHPDVAVSLVELAEIVAAQERRAEAVELYREALTILKRFFSDDHALTSRVESRLGVLTP